MAGEFSEVSYTLKEIRGEFNFDMDFGAMLADNPVQRATRATLNYNLLRGDPLINPERLLLDVLATQNTPDPESYLLTLRVPDEEHQMMAQGLPVEAHERDEHIDHIEAHDKLEAQLDQALSNPQLPGPQRTKIALMQHLLIAHGHDHIRLVQQATGQSPGKPVAENLLRNQIQAQSGSETTAELSGQPLRPEQQVS